MCGNFCYKSHTPWTSELIENAHVNNTGIHLHVNCVIMKSNLYIKNMTDNTLNYSFIIVPKLQYKRNKRVQTIPSDINRSACPGEVAGSYQGFLHHIAKHT